MADVFHTFFGIAGLSLLGVYAATLQAKTFSPLHLTRMEVVESFTVRMRLSGTRWTTTWMLVALDWWSRDPNRAHG
eukprot:1178751-Prorocentrum_minimum.AAC.1